jgi:beta-lactam-binding protein with PASTA domain
MKFFHFLRSGTLGAMLVNVGLAFGILGLIVISYFYIYLPGATNHGESITVPDLTGMKLEELNLFLTEHELRFEVDDSTYSEEYPPLTVLRQFPKAGSTVKENRMIYVSVNQVLPPTVPLPALTEGSRINAEVVLKSNELKRGRIILMSSPFLNMVIEMRYQGKKIEAGERLPKGAVIDLVVGDGRGPSDLVLGDLVGDTYDHALFKLEGWNLHLGRVEIPSDADTTGVLPYVWKQYPEAGDSVRVGDPVDLWIAPKNYVPPVVEEEETSNN